MERGGGGGGNAIARTGTSKAAPKDTPSHEQGALANPVAEGRMRLLQGRQLVEGSCKMNMVQP